MGVIQNRNKYSLHVNKIGNVKLLVGSKWSEIKGFGAADKILQSIFSLVDDGNGIIDRQESDLLGRMLRNSKLDKTLENQMNTFEDLEDEQDNKTYKISFYKKFARYVKDNIAKYRNETSQVESDNTGEKNNWSEGVNRKISKISIPANTGKPAINTLTNELTSIGKELGFEVKHCNKDKLWNEDYGIRRHDGKMLFTRDIAYLNGISSNANGGGIIELERSTAPENTVYTDALLEGGNVLNTLDKDGNPAAVVGEKSINMTLESLKLEKTDENVKKVKEMIANDLGLKPEKVTFISQHIFHIDMAFRPMNNGQVLIPDYDTGIKETEKLLEKEKSSGGDEYKISKLESYLKNLKIMAKKSSSKIAKAEKELQAGGYETVKIPCFTTGANSASNHMNGIAGTAKDGTKYYITNKSDIPEFDEIVSKQINNLGIDKVYFLSTSHFLKNHGGIDCLTQEY